MGGFAEAIGVHGGRGYAKLSSRGGAGPYFKSKVGLGLGDCLKLASDGLGRFELCKPEGTEMPWQITTERTY